MNTKIIPKEWQKLMLSNISIKLKTGGTPTSSNRDFYNGDIPFVKIDDMTTSGRYILKTKTHISESALKNSSAWIVPADSILYSIYATIGEVAINKVDLATNQAIIGIIPDNNKVNRDFLYYFLISIKPSLSRFFKETTQKNLTSEIVRKLEVLVPPLTEQNKIAEILSSVDEEIEKVDQEVKKTEELKRGLMAELLTKGIGHKKFKKIKIKEISEVTSSKRVMVSDYVNEGIPFYRSTEIIKKSKNLPIINSLHIPLEKFNFFKDRFGAPEKGDLLVTAVGTIGDVYMVQDEIFYFKDGNSIWIRKIKDYILPEYLRVILGSNFYREKLNNIAGGSSQKALTIQKLGNVEIPISSITEQKKITEILSEVDNKININKQIKNKLAELKRGLMQDLLSGRVRTVV